MEKFLLNKIIQLSSENAVLKNENQYLKDKLYQYKNNQKTELELRKRLINIKYKEV